MAGCVQRPRVQPVQPKGARRGGGEVSHLMVVLSSRTSSREAGSRVMMPSRSTSLAGLCGILRGVERPLLGEEEPASEEAGYGEWSSLI